MNTPYEKCKSIISSRPSAEEIRHWYSIDTRVLEKQKDAFNESVEKRSKQFDKWLKEYNANKKIKTNGLTFDQWAVEFKESVGMMSGLNRDTISTSHMRVCYNNNEQPHIAALEYIQKNEPEEEDADRLAQQIYAMATVQSMDELEQKYKNDIEMLLAA